MNFEIILSVLTAMIIYRVLDELYSYFVLKRIEQKKMEKFNKELGEELSQLATRAEIINKEDKPIAEA